MSKYKRKVDCTPEEWARRSQKQKEYTKKWKEKHPEKYKEIQQKQNEKRREKKRDYYKENKEKIDKKNKKWYKTHPTKAAEYQKRYRKKKGTKYINEKVKQRSIARDCLYEKWASKLTVDESPIADENGLLMVKDFHTGEYFYPRRRDVVKRVFALNHPGNGERHLYATERSKQECPIYHSSPMSHPARKKHPRIDPLWRETVIERANGHCERCGKASDVLHAHHIIPKGVCGMLEEDFDNGMALCPECHKEVHSTDGCRLHELAAEKRKAV